MFMYCKFKFNLLKYFMFVFQLNYDLKFKEIYCLNDYYFLSLINAQCFQSWWVIVLNNHVLDIDQNNSDDFLHFSMGKV